MDINTLRSVATVVSFLTFIGIVWWACSKRQRAAFSEAERIPLDDDAPYRPSGTAQVPDESGSREPR